MATFPIDLSPDLWRHQEIIKSGSSWTVEGRPTVSVQLTQLQTPPNLPGKTWLTLLVTAPSGAATPPHTHGGAAVVATMIKGRMLNQMIQQSEGERVVGESEGKKSEHENLRESDQRGDFCHSNGPKVYSPGESWYEMPGCHHVRSENAGDQGEEAQFVANLIVNSKTLDASPDPVAAVFVIDAEVEERGRHSES